MLTKTNNPAIATSDFVSAMAQMVSSVCIITTRFEGKRYGLTATAMCSVCAEPPRLLVCVSKEGASHEKIVKAGFFCVNVLAENQVNEAKAFAGMLGKSFDKFSLGVWQEMLTGAPALVGACAIFDCRVTQQIDQFTHSIFIGEVVAITSNSQDTLLYGTRKFRQLRVDNSKPIRDALEPVEF